MKTIKINFVDFWPAFNKTDNFIYNHLKRTYHVEISEQPDYIFCSFFGEEHWRYPNSIKIYYTGENIIPDFNIFDYAMGFNYIDFEDRYLRMPIYWIQNNDSFEPPLYGNLVQQVLKKSNFERSDLKKKTEFCSFVYSNSKACSKRQEFFELLCNYKKVNSGGRFLNNIGGPVEDKMKFQVQHKFAIAFENSQYPGYATEKIMEAFAAQTIPIYWGDPVITRAFNAKAFINCNDYENFDQVVERVKEIDQNDELYCAMMQEPAFNSEYSVEKEYECWNQFLNHIFDQPLDACKRRNDEEGTKGVSYSLKLKRAYQLEKSLRPLKKLKRFLKRK